MCIKKKENPNIPCVCELCEYAVIINDEENVLCSKKGIVGRGFKCKKYVYDPLKRIPLDIPKLSVLSEDDII